LLVLGGGGDFWLTAIAFLIIPLFVAANQVERELVNVIEVEFLGAANNHHILDPCVRINAKAGTAGCPSRQPQVKRQLRLRGNKGDDTLWLSRQNRAAPHLVYHGLCSISAHGVFFAWPTRIAQIQLSQPVQVRCRQQPLE
jgi:hypothetical protein